MDEEKCKKRRFKKMVDVMGWEKRKGKEVYIRYLKGEKISYLEAIAAKCYECEGGWPEGIKECEVYDCPLLIFHPYQKEKGIASEKSIANLQKRAPNL